MDDINVIEIDKDKHMVFTLNEVEKPFIVSKNKIEEAKKILKGTNGKKQINKNNIKVLNILDKDNFLLENDNCIDIFNKLNISLDINSINYYLSYGSNIDLRNKLIILNSNVFLIFNNIYKLQDLPLSGNELYLSQHRFIISNFDISRDLDVFINMIEKFSYKSIFINLNNDKHVKLSEIIDCFPRNKMIIISIRNTNILSNFEFSSILNSQYPVIACKWMKPFLNYKTLLRKEVHIWKKIYKNIEGYVESEDRQQLNRNTDDNKCKECPLNKICDKDLVGTDCINAFNYFKYMINQFI